MVLALLGLAYLGLAGYATIDCLHTPPSAVARFSPGTWYAVIWLVPLFGAAAWIAGGRDQWALRLAQTSGTGSGVPLGPDDDPEFLAALDAARRHRENPPLD